MMTILLAAAAASAPVPPTDPDLRCMAAYLMIAGNAKDYAAVSAEDRLGMQSLVMYFFGKLDGRRPGANLQADIRRLIESPNYTGSLSSDIARCNTEAEARGKYLQSFGDQAETAAPKP